MVLPVRVSLSQALGGALAATWVCWLNPDCKAVPFAGVTANSIFLTPTLTYPSQQQVVLTLSALPFASAAATPNQTATANALNAGPFNALASAIFTQTTVAGARQAFNALSGEIFGSLQNTIADETQLIRSTILGRLWQASFADEGGDLAALGSSGAALAFAEPSGNPLAQCAHRAAHHRLAGNLVGGTARFHRPDRDPQIAQTRVSHGRPHRVESPVAAPKWEVQMKHREQRGLT